MKNSISQLAEDKCIQSLRNVNVMIKLHKGTRNSRDSVTIHTYIHECDAGTFPFKLTGEHHNKQGNEKPNISFFYCGHGNNSRSFNGCLVLEACLRL
ncbi:conserved hypothetical protein [Ricinus communis]|uniref:Uncharacterized protein n=1 Tax=Ricinus communis TaxID=3988 RepID=B9SFV9_RICCO|nr:conserved hypothetical protein [Ricinus communis]